MNGKVSIWKSCGNGWAFCVAVCFLSGGIAETAEAAQAAARNRLAILNDAAAGTDERVVAAVADALRREAFEVVALSAAEAGDPSVLTPERYFLYVLPNPAAYPASGTNALARYLQNKGSLLVLGTPVIPGQPLIETVSPAYKQYPLKEIASLKVAAAQGILPDARLPTPSSASSCYARPEGKGFERGYKWRWIPLVRAHDKDGMERGTAAWMLIHQKPLSEGAAFQDAVRRLIGKNKASVPLAAEGSICAVCAVDDPDALKAIAGAGLFGRMARRISDGLFFTHAGAQEFSCRPGEKIRLGAEVADYGAAGADVEVRMRVCPKGSRDAVFEAAARVTARPGEPVQASFEWAPERFGSACYVVTAELAREGKVIDVIAHELGVLPAEKASADDFVSVRGGEFSLKGKRWNPVGANYWPRYAIALEQEDYVYHWLTPGFYNPEEVEKDLALLEAMGANFVAIRVHHENDRRTVLDFLRRCLSHDIRALVYLSTHVVADEPIYFQGVMTPFGFQKENVAAFLSATGLADNPAVMGWDLIWEPNWWVFNEGIGSFGWERPNYRQRWDKDWAAWIGERYGCLADAEADWGMPVPRTKEGAVTSPSGKQLTSDGAWRVMVCAYRRFMADLMNRHWNNAVGELRRLDPHHLISYRQGNLPYCDFTFTATHKHIDFFAMEGYDFKPGKPTNAVDVAGFVNRFIPYVTRGKPFMWLEYGESAWDRKSMTPAVVDYQGQCHELINRTAYENGANGLAPWWMAGGYRISEKSDFGFFNPDGTLRSSGESLKKYGALFRTAPKRPLPPAPFTVDGDSHSGGLPHLARHEGAAAFAKAAAEGKWLEVRSPGTGTTSADAPLVAVGNTPYNGKNPPKYLNAEFNVFRIKAGGGAWFNVTNGASLRVPRNTPVIATASVGNLQEATWLTPARCAGKPGAVYLASTGASALTVKVPLLADTPYLGDASFGESFLLSSGLSAETKADLQMTAEGRAWFGEKLRFTLVPQ